MNKIPIEVIKAEINGINLANQCDMATSNDLRFKNALNMVLDWYNSPSYQDRLKSMRYINEDDEKLKQYKNTGLTPEEIIDGNMLTGWIGVEEQLPPLDEDGYNYVLVSLDDEFVATTDYTRDEGFGLWADSGEVIAWQPLPEPYKAE